QLLKQTDRIDHVVCPSPLEASVLEVRLIHRLEPPFNRQLKTWRRYVYLKIGQERLSIVKSARDDDATYLGPLPSHRTAKQVIAAIATAMPFDRHTAPTVRHALTHDPSVLLGPIEERMRSLAAAERFED